jgi:hypothetical protein
MLPASRAGFAPYLRERLYRREGPSPHAHAAPEGLRRRTREDLHGVFQLYNSVVPHEVRRVEAVTFSEWLATQENIGKTNQHVLERAGRICGWLRVARDGDLARFDVLAGPDVLGDVVDAALAKTAGSAAVCALLPEYARGAASLLEAHGFTSSNEYAVLSRRTVRHVKAPSVAASFVHTALR